MKEANDHEHQVRRFLLGQVKERERQQLEQSLMVDADFREQVLIVEASLIEDYLDGQLPLDEQKAFETIFLASTQQRRKVKVAELLMAYNPAGTSNSVRQQAPNRTPHSWTVGVAFRNHPIVFTCLIAILLLTVALSFIQMTRLRREQAQSLAAQRQHAELESELARLNSGSDPNLTNKPHTLLLSPVTLRGMSDMSTLQLPLLAEIVEIELLISSDTYTSYTVEFSRSGAGDKLLVDGLHAQTKETGRVVVVKLPSRILRVGEYRLSLTGPSSDNQKITVGEYHFQVSS